MANGISPPINRLPAGFLGFVDVKQMGKNPSHIADTVAPVVDMTSFYVAGSRSTKQGPSVALGAGGPTRWVSDVFVPTGKCWMISEIEMVAAGVLGAGGTFQGYLMVLDPTGQSQWVSDPTPQYVTGDRVNHAAYLERPFIALPGYVLAVDIVRNAGGAVTALLRCSVVEFDY